MRRRDVNRQRTSINAAATIPLMLAIAAVAVAMSHYCRSRYDLVAILKTLGAGRAQLRKLIIGQWLMVLTLSGVTGGLFGLLFERVLVVLLKPVLPGELPPASLWPWLWALGTMTVISLLVGLRPYRLLLATQPLRVLRRDVVANVWPLKVYLPEGGFLQPEDIECLNRYITADAEMPWVGSGSTARDVFAFAEMIPAKLSMTMMTGTT